MTQSTLPVGTGLGHRMPESEFVRTLRILKEKNILTFSFYRKVIQEEADAQFHGSHAHY